MKPYRKWKSAALNLPALHKPHAGCGLSLMLLVSIGVYADEPALPAGLDQDVYEPNLPIGLESDKPSRPSGLGINNAEPDLPLGLEKNEPSLPEGLNVSILDELDADRITDASLEISGFLDVRIGQWVDKQPYLENRPLNETRLQLKLEKEFSATTVTLAGDFIYDDAADDRSIELESGRGWLDLRAANIVFSPLKSVDVRLGRQVLTWGTGDLLFINDLFPQGLGSISYWAGY